MMLTQHDYYCRCRLCKPPLVGQTSRTFDALLCLLFILALGFAAYVAIRGLMS